MHTGEEDFEYDVALSYAGEERQYVREIAERLRRHGVRVFFDQFAAAETWGADLVELFDEIFRKRARFAVVFVSNHYVNKPWPSHERRSALARALTELGPYLLPVQLDGSEVPGLRPTIGYVDARSTTKERVVELILEKLGRATPSPPTAGVPHTPEQRRRLLATRPIGWEYLLFAGVLAQAKRTLEPKWRDHQLRLVRPAGPSMDDTQAIEFIERAMHEGGSFGSNVERVLEPGAQEWAFGSPGQDGDPENIEYLGQRLAKIYEDFLDWSAQIRGARVSSRLSHLFEIAQRFMDLPITRMQEFIDDFVAQCDRLPELLAEEDDRPIRMTFNLIIEVDEQITREFRREIKRVRRRGFFG